MNLPWIVPAGGLAVLVGIMTLAWLWQRRTGNAGIVDPIWSASLGILAVTYALVGSGWAPRRALVAALVGAWSLRLTTLLVRRVRSEKEDGRYAILRERWGEKFHSWMFWFYQAQAVLAVGLSLAFLFLCEVPEAGWSLRDGIAVGLWVASFGGETLADRQLHDWRAAPENRGRTCRSGLWAYSRHPNYFFEWVHWLVYPVLGVGLSGGWVLWLAPALMLYLVLEVTGIPPTEAQAVRSRGQDYVDYQRTTNAFFPGPRRSGPERVGDPS